jgi:integrase
MTKNTKSYKGTLFQRGKIWWVEYSHKGADGQPVRVRESLGVTNRKDAVVEAIKRTESLLLKSKAGKLETVLRDRVNHLLDQVESLEKKRNRIPLAEAWQKFPYIESTRGNSRRPLQEKTIRTNQQIWNLFVDWMAKTKPNAKYLEDVTDADAAGYSNYCHDSIKLSERSCNHRAEICRVIFNLVGLNHNPFAKVRRWSEVNEGRDCLTMDEIQRILVACSGELRTLVMLGLFSGMRLADCVTLQWQNLKDGRLYRITRKTGKPISIGLMAPLAEELKRLPVPVDGKGPVLPGLAASFAHDPPSLSVKIRKLFESVGIEVCEKSERRRTAVSRRGFHSLRATFISLAAKNNIPTQMIAAWIGHSPQTDKLYQRFSNTDRDDRIMAALAPVAALASTPASAFDVEAVEIQDIDIMRAEICQRVALADRETLTKLLAIL